ncbi:MAG: FAD-dependent oxidoreductase, partial [Dehalococcoidia bacterium]|nr:FAD-dependent oxidoreductase [Dehalococcoidia bacterium]
ADLQKQGYAAIFLGAGAWSGQKMSIPGEDTPGVMEALRFLRESRLGNATKLGERVAVVGGGNAAIDAARVALRLGAKQVSILYRRSKAEMPADPREVEDAEHEGIKVELLTAPTKVLAKGGKLIGLECVRMELGEPDASGRRRPVPVKGSEFTVNADSVIIAIGQAVDKSALPQGVSATEKGTLQVDPVTLQTSAGNVFAGGDLVTGPASVIEAISAGKEAAISIDKYLRKADMKADRPVKLPKVTEVNKEGIAKQARHEPGTLPAEARKRGFDEVELVLDADAAVAEAKRCLNCAVCSECLQCVSACGPGAIDHRMKDEILELSVGAVVACPGYSLYDPKLSEEFGFGRYPNVVTSMQFERLLSASGPTRGHIARASDHKDPKRIAFLQCIGSRDQNHPYCSSVCCMYATKEAMLAQEHVKGVEATVFYMDIRAFGKGFDAFYQRAINKGVKYIRSRPSSIKEVPGTHNLLLKYTDPAGEIIEEEFDIVVLSIGLEAPKDAVKLAQSLGIKTEETGFCLTEPYHPVETSRPGVFIAGAFAEPKDIPDSVTQASGAAAAALAVVGKSRGTLLSTKAYPVETDVEKSEPRIGVFICHCGSNIAGVVDVASVTEFAKTLPNVAFADHLMYSCSADSLRGIVDMVREHNLNRVVVSSCTPRTHESLFQDTIREAGLNPFLFEMANIRDQCSWVHSGEPEKATAKAKSLVAMAVARAALLRPLHKEHLGLNHSALVVGGGVAGMSAALVLADQGFPVVIVEQDRELGGRVRQIWNAVEGGNPQEFLNSLVQKVTHHPNIEVVTGSRVLRTAGSVGNFKTTITSVDNPIQRLIEHGVAILATGGNEYRGSEFFLGQDSHVITMGDLEDKIKNSPQDVAAAKDVAMITCVGPWKEKSFYCSRTCCTVSIKNAIKIKELNPAANVYILHKDLRSFGFKERLYTKAREMGVIFVRYDDDRPPRLEKAGDRLEITLWEPNLQEEMKLTPDILALATATVPTANAKDLSLAFKVPITQEGFFLEAHVKLRPVDFASEGIFLCGTAHYPKFIDETISQAMAAAARASTILAKEYLEAGGAVSVVDPKKCVACLTCVRVCPYNVPRINADGVAEISMASCQGCGVCAGECPAKAIELMHYRDIQIECKPEALMKYPVAVKS